MSHKFQSSIQHRSDVSYVKLGGVIDEDNELAELVDKIPTGTAVIDLGEIERINSCGVRDWVNWLSKLENNGTRSVLVECSPAIVAQINLVNNFTGSGVVGAGNSGCPFNLAHLACCPRAILRLTAAEILRLRVGASGVAARLGFVAPSCCMARSSAI
jgi:anti-anti-sigma regulatory factor